MGLNMLMLDRPLVFKRRSSRCREVWGVLDCVCVCWEDADDADDAREALIELILKAFKACCGVSHPYTACGSNIKCEI